MKLSRQVLLALIVYSSRNKTDVNMCHLDVSSYFDWKIPVDCAESAKKALYSAESATGFGEKNPHLRDLLTTLTCAILTYI